MTDHFPNLPPRRRPVAPAWLVPATLAIAAATLAPAGTAHAASGESARPGLFHSSGASAEQSDEDAVDRVTRDVPPPPPPQQGVARFDDTGVELYGPPSPKVEKGRLANVTWNDPPIEVPPALQEAISIVTRNYPSVMSARAALRAAHSDVKVARWQYFPSASGNISYLDSSTKPEPQLAIEQPIWSGGRIEANIRRAKASEDASSAEYVATVQNLALTTSNTYFEIVRLTRSEQLLAESVKVHNQLVETMERRVKQEVSPVADLELARSRASQIDQQYTVTRQQRSTALRFLAELVADPTYDLGPVPYYDPEIDLPSRESLEEQSAIYNPVLRQLRAEADIARADVDTRKASILPQLNAQYTYDNVFGSRLGVVVRAQSQPGLAQFSEINSAKLRIQSALENVRVSEQQLRRDVAADVILFESAKRRAAISTVASDTAARVSASYMRQFIAGRRSWLDVMNALREAVTAQLAQVDSELSVMSAASRLMLRSGRWRPQFEDLSEDFRPDAAPAGK